MEKVFVQQFEALLEKYSELLVGESNEEVKEKVKAWALYTHIAKSMPALAKHWNELYPDGKEEIKQIVGEIKQMNEKHRKSAQ
ncbi:YusU family protein [Neobacillus sp. PS2-9]|uniref:YusU family protein n=1 Tax=Neobacillus sp. PS2-9 TaxID=3070676 RepID=UPI0027E01977|nr:YusU family protein [Neobacillus sp. PS2-9]WML60670.1 YusU family protein [Neobacillus sp. PS2-9]